MLISGRIAAFVVLLVLFLAVYLSLREASSKEEVPYIRRVAALDAIDEAVERCAEMNRPIMAVYGLSPFGPATLAALSIVGYTARLVARTGSEIIVPCGGDTGTSIVYPQAIETVRSAYDQEGKLEDFKLESVRFLSESQFAWATAQIGIIHGEKVGASIMTGGFGPEIIAISEETKSVGAIAIASGSIGNLCALAVICDYILIGEEQLAAGAYLSRDRLQIGTIRGQDWGKIVAVVLIVIGVVAMTAGSKVIINLLLQ